MLVQNFSLFCSNVLLDLIEFSISNILNVILIWDNPCGRFSCVLIRLGKLKATSTHLIEIYFFCFICIMLVYGLGICLISFLFSYVGRFYARHCRWYCTSHMGASPYRESYIMSPVMMLDFLMKPCYSDHANLRKLKIPKSRTKLQGYFLMMSTLPLPYPIMIIFFVCNRTQKISDASASAPLTKKYQGRFTTKMCRWRIGEVLSLNFYLCCSCLDCEAANFI